MRVMHRRSKQPKGVREKDCQRVCINCFIRYLRLVVSLLPSRGNDYVDDFVGGLYDVFFFDEVQEHSFEGRCADTFADFAGGAVSDDLSFS